jgi:hypothetical protein
MENNMKNTGCLGVILGRCKKRVSKGFLIDIMFNAISNVNTWEILCAKLN